MAWLITWGASPRVRTGQQTGPFLASPEPCRHGTALAGVRSAAAAHQGGLPHMRPGSHLVIATLLVATAAYAAQPDVVSTSPVRNTMAPANTTISITFDEPLLTS